MQMRTRTLGERRAHGSKGTHLARPPAGDDHIAVRHPAVPPAAPPLDASCDPLPGSLHPRPLPGRLGACRSCPHGGLPSSSSHLSSTASAAVQGHRQVALLAVALAASSSALACACACTAHRHQRLMSRCVASVTRGAWVQLQYGPWMETCALGCLRCLGSRRKHSGPCAGIQTWQHIEGRSTNGQHPDRGVQQTELCM
jgi:hypothetical protein